MRKIHGIKRSGQIVVKGNDQEVKDKRPATSLVYKAEHNTVRGPYDGPANSNAFRRGSVGGFLRGRRG